jgi:hypothetical protein
VDFVNVVK